MGRLPRRTAAIELADVFQRHAFSADQASTVEPYVWAMAAELAGHPDTPDAETRERVIKLLRGREASPDPFVAFQVADR